MLDAQRVGELFDIDDSVVSMLPDAAAGGTSQDRLFEWSRYASSRGLQFGVEYLLPRIRQQIQGEWPPFTQRRRGHLDMSPDDLGAVVERLRPWTIPYSFAPGIDAIQDAFVAHLNARRNLYRRDLICKSVAELLGPDAARARVLDIGCQGGFFSMDLAERGVAEQWDVVMNLGVLYHVVNPLQFIRQTYELCRSFAIIDTMVHREPVSGYFLCGDIDLANPGQGRETYELRPTYRGAIDTIRYAGFRDVLEIVGDADTPHEFYSNGSRRCFLAIK
jgi:SAM-dependent methyltransferase